MGILWGNLLWNEQTRLASGTENTRTTVPLSDAVARSFADALSAIAASGACVLSKHLVGHPTKNVATAIAAEDVVLEGVKLLATAVVWSGVYGFA